MNVKVRNNV